MIDFKVGIIGAGNIAKKVADTLNKLDAFVPYAIASRDLEKSNSFGEEFNIKKRYGSYEELINDPEVELCYIATPHSNHAEIAKQCINAGKPCLVEKAFSYNAATTEEVLKLSEEKKIFCGEAMWIRYMPTYKFLHTKLQEGIIGEIQQITCNIGYDLKHKERMVKPELAGGVLLDLGVYPINLFTMIFGEIPINISASCQKLASGVDAQMSINMIFPKGKAATAFATMMYNTDNKGYIYGSKGYVEIDNINCPENIKIYSAEKNTVADLAVGERQISGYEFEFIEARNAVIIGNVDTPEMPHSETLRIMKLTDELRKAWNIKFPME